jgi:dUTP pyrophosphatase
MLNLEFISSDISFVPQLTANNAGADLKIDLFNHEWASKDDIDSILRIYGAAYFSGQLNKQYIFNCQSVIIAPGQTKCIPLGFKVNLNSIYLEENLVPYLQIVSRSGMASKGLIVANAPGIVDVGYVDEVKVLLHNQSDIPHVLAHGDRVAQCMIQFSERYQPVLVDSFDAEDRGGGFGSTGV